MDEGIVPGGGATLVYCLRFKEDIAAKLEEEDEKLAVDLLFRAIQVPICR
jgi:chaperonin GroEL (HSP60 family)